ncbi:MAG: carboxypeptidase-like regulatory domain-containing protein [Bacteroidales bacterium]|nr:carboxypeptidase-like regulatory domain-containing protein [Bacteroidales bacterium]
MKNLFITLLLAVQIALPSVAQTLQGVILLNDSTPCPYATVYVASANRGIAANEKGEYMLDELPAGNLKVEYSCMG